MFIDFSGALMTATTFECCLWSIGKSKRVKGHNNPYYNRKTKPYAKQKQEQNRKIESIYWHRDMCYRRAKCMYF